ncbi:MAG TPA: HIT family protein [Candidatus Limnocylindria bacterium]|jgi:diadenosine tetraphosphate (Ap4A) HIT family hydrolase|nr:HIT family protein [Candidatus Limnocylindria bacterium]
MSCVFCEIVAGREPASFVHRDAEAVAFMNIREINEGHTLVVPTRHAASLADLDAPSAAAMWSLALRVAAALRRSHVRCDGVNLLLSDGAVAGQDVFHTHLHVVPRWPGDGFGFRLPSRHDAPLPREQLDETAARIEKVFH